MYQGVRLWVEIDPSLGGTRQGPVSRVQGLGCKVEVCVSGLRIQDSRVEGLMVEMRVEHMMVEMRVEGLMVEMRVDGLMVQKRVEG